MFALEGKPKKVYTCEESVAMFFLATEVFRANLSEADAKIVNIIRKNSTLLTVPQFMNERVSLVIAEVLDCALFGENILPTLIHAWKNLMKPSGVVIPHSATFYLCGIESAHIAKKWQLQNLPTGLGLEDFCVEMRDYGVYDSEFLETVPGGYTVMTNTVSAVTVNFNSLADMEAILSGQKDLTITLKCKKPGSLAGVAGWFRLHVAKGVMLETKPGKVKHHITLL